MSTPTNTPNPSAKCGCVEVKIAKKTNKQTKKNLIIAGSVIGGAAVITSIVLGLVYGLKDSTKKELKDKAQEIVDQAKEKIHDNTTEKFQGIKDQVVSQTKENVQEVKENVQDNINKVKENVQEKVDEIKDSSLTGEIRLKVEKQPGQQE